MSERRPAALFLDLDGTLADSLPAMRGAYETFLHQHSRTPDAAEFDALNGPSLHEIVGLLRARHHLSAPAEVLFAHYRDLIAARHAADARAAPGAHVLLDAAARLGVATWVVTSAEGSIAEAFIAAQGWSVQGIVTAEGLARSKPDPAIYRRALAAAHVDAEAAWAVEDAPHGIAAAVGAGITTFALGAAGANAPGVTGRLTSLAELVVRLECDVAPLPAGFVVRAERTQGVLSPSVEARVARHWEVARAAPPTHYDSPLLAWAGQQGSVLRGRFVSYRHYLAQRHEPSLFIDDPIVPLSVSGLVLHRDQVALAHRAQTTQYPGWLELVPSGGIDIERLRPDGTVDHEAQLLLELEEETGIARAGVRRVTPLALLRDRVDPVVDLASLIEVDETGRAAVDRTLGRGNHEYSGLRWVPRAALRRFLDEEPRIVPTSRALCEYFLAAAPGVTSAD